MERMKSKTDFPVRIEDVDETTASVLNDFVDKTTLFGVQHVLRRKSICWRMFWLSIYLVFVAMSLYQSWEAVVEFFGETTVQRFVTSSRRLLPFPSVTICTYALLPPNFNMSLITGFDVNFSSTDQGCASDDDLEEWEQKNRNNALAVLRYLRALDEGRRRILSMDINRFVKKCSFGIHKCDFSDEKEVIEFNHPYYGNCFTFNPGLDFKSTKEVDVNTRLDIQFHVNNTGYTIGQRKNKASVLLHPPGTAPVMDSASVADVGGGQRVEFTLKLSEKHFIQSFCVDHTAMKYRQKSIYFRKNLQYLYSMEACMKSCEQKFIAEECGLVDAMLPIQPDEIETKSQVEIPPITCNITKEISMENCGCPIPCSLVQYQVLMDTSELNIPICNGTGRRSRDSSLRKQTVRILVYFGSNVYESIKEELQYSWSEFMGIIGGNLSLWIGLCFLSIMELLELSWNLLRVLIKKKTTGQEHLTAVSVLNTNYPRFTQTAFEMRGPIRVHKYTFR